jgi:divalent metal cation (Fe/Co/Zn/Cd) transporter
VDGSTDVRAAHETASAIEHEIEQALGCGVDGGDATAHVEPAE